MTIARQVFVTLDCADPKALVSFWAAMLDGEIVFETPQALGLRSDALMLAAMRVDDYVAPTWPSAEVPKQMHFDLAVDDLDAAAAEAERVGARPAEFQPDRDARRIMLDPAGHPFCLSARVPRF